MRSHDIHSCLYRFCSNVEHHKALSHIISIYLVPCQELSAGTDNLLQIQITFFFNLGDSLCDTFPLCFADGYIFPVSLAKIKYCFLFIFLVLQPGIFSFHDNLTSFLHISSFFHTCLHCLDHSAAESLFLQDAYRFDGSPSR